jgi:hypothetical protein
MAQNGKWGAERCRAVREENLLSLRRDEGIDNVLELLRSASSARVRLALTFLFATRTIDLIDQVPVSRTVFRELVYFLKMDGAPASVVEVWTEACKISRLLLIARDYRGTSNLHCRSTLLKSLDVVAFRLIERARPTNMPSGSLAKFAKARLIMDMGPDFWRDLKLLSPKRELELFASRCRRAGRSGDGLLAARAEYELSPYSQDVICRLIGSDKFPDFRFHVVGNKLRASRDQCHWAADIADLALKTELSLNHCPRKPMHDEAVRGIKLAMQKLTGKHSRRASVLICEGVVAKRVGTQTHDLIARLGQLVGLKLVSPASDDRIGQTTYPPLVDFNRMRRLKLK